MKFYICVSFALTLIPSSFGIGREGAYDGYHLIEVDPVSNEQIKGLHKIITRNTMLDVWSEPRREGEKAQILIPPELVYLTKKELTKDGLKFQTLHENYGRVVDENLADIEGKRRRIKRQNGYDYNVYHTYEEIMIEVDDMLNRCPHGFKCEVYSIGKSYEGRDQKVLKIFKDEPDRQVYWVDSMIHAREWLAGAGIQKIVNYILTNHNADHNVKNFLDKGDWHFLFVVNPDGYSFTWTDERLWRKNRFNNTLTDPTTNCSGIDLNRNFLHRWRNSGTVQDPCDYLYPGISPSSEIEVRNVQEEVLRLKTRLKAFVTLHTAARMVLTPYGSIMDPGTEERCEYLTEPERMKVQNVADAMGIAIQGTHGYHEWKYGTFCDVLYPAGGTEQDFVTSVTGLIYSFTPELRDMNASNYIYNFEAPESEIQPAFEEMWNGMVAMVNSIEEQEGETSGAETGTPLTLLFFVLTTIAMFDL